jgi:hypothetical protein
VPAIKRDDLVTFYARIIIKQLALIVVGDVKMADDLGEKLWWMAGRRSDAGDRGEQKMAARPGIYLVDMPGAVFRIYRSGGHRPASRITTLFR